MKGQKYQIVLKTGIIVEVTTKNDKDPIGLWIWSTRQRNEQVMSCFVECAILANEIAMITPIFEEPQKEEYTHGHYENGITRYYK